ncbi:hypothetical protein CDAR_196761 [Caerostris darwini]|uniref:Uncharacterized protein n=1 Tax=Caerostris darwini TaxID=1538125 RepID=A0AAV4PZV9_9ARAC|nr:hypothetical protein CDAR_196761 [Caerostris darwini]
MRPYENSHLRPFLRLHSGFCCQYYYCSKKAIAILNGHMQEVSEFLLIHHQKFLYGAILVYDISIDFDKDIVINAVMAAVNVASVLASVPILYVAGLYYS